MFFVFSLFGHWIFAWFAFVDEQRALQQPPQLSEYIIQTSRDTLENWQSEFLQLMWQVGGLATFLYVGSPQSKEGDERKEELLNLILQRVDPENAKQLIRNLEKRYPKG